MNKIVAKSLFNGDAYNTNANIPSRDYNFLKNKEQHSKLKNHYKHYQMIHISSTEQRQAWVYRKKLYIPFIPKVFEQNQHFYVQISKGNMIESLKSYSQLDKPKVFYQILKTIHQLTNIYGLFYVDQQMIKISSMNEPCIWIHHNNNKNHREFPLAENQYAQNIFFERVKRIFSSILQFPSGIKTLLKMISFMKQNAQEIKWKFQPLITFRTQINNPEYVKSDKSNIIQPVPSFFQENTHLKQIKSSSMLGISNQYKKICTQHIRPTKLKIQQLISSNFEKNHEKNLSSRNKSVRKYGLSLAKYKNGVSLSEFEKRDTISFCSSFNQVNHSIDQQYFRDFRSQPGKNASKLNNSPVTYRRLISIPVTNTKQTKQNKGIKQIVPVATNKVRKNSVTVQTMNHEWTSSTTCNSFPHSTFSTRITCDSYTRQNSNEIVMVSPKNQKNDQKQKVSIKFNFKYNNQIVDQSSSYKTGSFAHSGTSTAIKGHEVNDHSLWIESNSSNYNIKQWNVDAQIPQQQDSCVIDEVDKLFESDCNNDTINKLEFQSTQLALQVDGLFDSPRKSIKLKNKKQDYLEEFENFLF